MSITNQRRRGKSCWPLLSFFLHLYLNALISIFFPIHNCKKTRPRKALLFDDFFGRSVFWFKIRSISFSRDFFPNEIRLRSMTVTVIYIHINVYHQPMMKRKSCWPLLSFFISISTLLSLFSFPSTIAKKLGQEKPFSSMIFWQITPFDSRFAQSPSLGTFS